MEHIKRFKSMLEKGFARMTYTDLYSQGAMTQKEYLKIMEQLDKNNCWDVMKDFRDDPAISDNELKEIEKFINTKPQ